IDLLNNFHGTLICISHDLFFLQEICSRALVLDQGMVHHDYTMDEMMTAPSALRVHGLDYSFRYSCCKRSSNGYKLNLHEGDMEAPGIFNLPQGKINEWSTHMESVISLHDYSFDYQDGTQGLNSISLSIKRKECVALVGENGAGKSTLALCLIGILAGRGRYFFSSREVREKNRKDLWNNIGIIFQDSADQLFCPTCWEEVAFGLKQKKMPKEDIEKKVREALAMVNLDGYESRPPLDMSGGERKRLAIASVICLQPKVLIMDEPTAGLDPKSEKMFLSIVEKLEMTKILISHDMFFIRNHCRRVLVMHEGKILYDCSIEHFIKENHLISRNRLDYSLHVCGLQPKEEQA
ncbi:MAG: ATP-binding cassette domain-containing protein, partial [Nitrospirota bacterium]